MVAIVIDAMIFGVKIQWWRGGKTGTCWDTLVAGVVLNSKIRGCL